jgi:CO dehydrogenase maturation factor
MTTTIAFAGKGGTGKTTVAALLIRALLERGGAPLLAIDADPAANLHLALGLPMPFTVGEIREDMAEAAQKGQLGVSISRHDYLTREIQMALEEGTQIDLLAMGRPEGQGCYCAVNHLLRQIIDDLGKTYATVVIDNEAGMEHISRRTTRDVDLLLLVTDPTVRGVRTAAGMAQLARDLEINVRHMLLLVNRAEGELPEPLQAAIQELGLEVAATIPADEHVNELDALGRPLLDLDDNSLAAQAVDRLATSILERLQGVSAAALEPHP